MSNEELTERLIVLEQEYVNLEARMNGMEGMQKTLTDLVNSVAVIATKQTHIAELTDSISHKVENLELDPGRKFDEIFRTAIAAILSATATFLITRFLA